VAKVGPNVQNLAIGDTVMLLSAGGCFASPIVMDIENTGHESLLTCPFSIRATFNKEWITVLKTQVGPNVHNLAIGDTVMLLSAGGCFASPIVVSEKLWI
jgi:NADPH:quinone reductase-like Zn-dependent oxidoreductase